MGRTGHPALILGTTALVVAAVGSGVALTRTTGPVAKAATTLTRVVNTTLVTPAGIVTTARAGQRVPNGDVVRTGTGGSAELATRGRVVYLQGNAAIAVIDGAHQQLRTGTAVIDAQHGPALRLDMADDIVAIPAGSATEAMRSVSVQVGSLAGPAELTSSNGRRLVVPALSQAVVSGDALPETTTPLHLTDDPAEAHVVPTLVGDDAALKTLAAGINASGSATAHVIQSSWTGAVTPLPPAAPRSEAVLPMVIADATHAAGGSVENRYDQVIGWRSQGGSWGVTVALLKAHAAAVERAFASLQHGQPTGTTGTTPTTSVHALAAAPGFGTRPHHQATTKPSTRPSTPATPGGSSGPPTGGTTPTPTPTHGLVDRLAGTVGGTLGAVVGTVLDLLPPPTPTPATHATPTHPAATPHPSPSAPTLLGTLLGGH